MNPYQAPKAKVEAAQQVGELWRRGGLVRMDRAGALPDRCIVCNADAGGHRVTRKLYWSPLAWRLAALATPFVVLGIGIAKQIPLLGALFWPLVLVMMIAHTFVRKRLELEMGMCKAHQRWLSGVRWVSALFIIGVFASIALWRTDPGLAGWVLMGSIGGMVVAGIAQGLAGVQAIALKRIDQKHAWLSGTGRRFRETLPELPS